MSDTPQPNSARPGVLITGAARRLGAHLARGLAADGWHAFVHYHRSADAAEAVVRAIVEAGGSASALGADLTDPDQVDGLIGRARADGVQLRALINNASSFLNDDLASLDRERWRINHATNLEAPVFLAKAFAAALPAGTEGVIVNMLDNKVFALNPDFFSYTLAKVGLRGATEMLAMALAPRIRVAGIAPGVTLISGKQTHASFERAQRMTPLGRGATPDQILAAARFILASPAFTGQVITIDGGQVLEKLPRDVAYLAER
ncbi:MAG: SDR family oxidoreductase [Azospirillaceae bacterium]